jgi:hypothetical protein
VSNARAFIAARALGWSVVVGLVIGAIAGLSNPRYGVPTLVLVGPLVAYVARGGFGGAFTEKRAAVARVLLGVRPWVWPVVLCAAGLVYGGVLRPAGRDEGMLAGERIAAAIAEMDAGPAELWSSRAVYARPEVVWYAERAAEAAGARLEGKWRRAAIGAIELPPVGTYMLLRDDELAAYVERHDELIVEITTLRFEGRRDYTLVRVAGD